MDKIGVIKNKILRKLVESYTKKDKKELKEVISLLKENKDFRELYLFYENIENKYFENEDFARKYLDEIIPLLTEKYTKLIPFIKKLDSKLGNIDYEKNILYENIDILISEKTINNTDKKILAKEYLIKHLNTKKSNDKKDTYNLVENENLFLAILTNNFNVLYENTMTESEKEELKMILEIPNENVENEINKLKETILDKISKLLVENSDAELTKKLENARDEVNKIDISKYNLYKLQQLKNGLD